MKRSEMYELVECAFNRSKLEEAICEALEDLIDYDAVAEKILEEAQNDIDFEEIVLSVARQVLDLPPF